MILRKKKFQIQNPKYNRTFKTVHKARMEIVQINDSCKSSIQKGKTNLNNKDLH